MTTATPMPSAGCCTPTAMPCSPATRPAWGELWTGDATWELGPGRVVEGRDAIVDHWRAAMADYRHVVQLYLSSTATFDGDEAAGRAYLVELNVPIEGDRRVLVGWYEDAYRRTSRRLAVLPPRRCSGCTRAHPTCPGSSSAPSSTDPTDELTGHDVKFLSLRRRAR